MFTLNKTSYETIEMSWDFAAQLAAGETITLDSITAVLRGSSTDTTAAVVAASPAAVVSGSKVIFYVTGGASGQMHDVSIKVTTSLSQKLEGLMLLEIEN